MPAGRPPTGPDLVRGLAGSPQAKRRLRAILQTIAGERSVKKVCEDLGIGEAAFYKLRARTLQEAVEGLEPRPMGRPPGEHSEASEKLGALEGEVARLERELEAARVREEIALALPELARGRKKKRR
jgi:transposase-like protein